MIRNESLQLASLIAMAPNLNVRPTPLLQSLTDASFGSLIYGENFVQEVQHVTGENEHTFILDEQSGQLAAIIRNSLATIRDYGIPVAKAVALKTADIGSTKRVRESSLSEVEFRYVNVDEPFFDSSVYPTEVRNSSFTYAGIDLSKLDTLDWVYVTDDVIKEFIGTDHPELVTILNDPECSMSYVAETFFTTRDMKEKFFHNGKVIDFTKVKIGDIHLLLKAYILFAKMYASEDPAPWLKGGSLEDYREVVGLIYNGLIVYLINLKKLVVQYRQIGLAVSLQKMPFIQTSNKNKLEVKGTVYFTNSVLEAVMSKGYALADLLVGMYFGAAVNNKAPSYSELLENPGVAKANFDRYLNMFVEGATANLRELFMDAGYEAISKLINSVPELKERLFSGDVLKRGANGVVNETYNGWITRKFQMALEHCFIVISALDCDGDGEGAVISDEPVPERPNQRVTAILNTRLVPIFLEAMGCDLAAEIINSTYIEQQSEDNVASQRERIRVAVINVLVNRLLVKA